MTRDAVAGVGLRVRDLDDRRAGVVQLLEELHDLAALARVQVAGRLVGEDDLRVGDDRARDGDELLLAAGELVRIEVLLADDVEAIEDVADHAVALGLLDVAIRQRHVEVLVHRQMIEQVIALEHEADVLLVQPRAILRAQPVHRLAAEVVLAGPRAVVHADDVQQRRFAGARRPHDRDELAVLDVERDAPQHPRPGRAVRVRLLEIAQRDERLGRNGSRSAGAGAGAGGAATTREQRHRAQRIASIVWESGNGIGR